MARGTARRLSPPRAPPLLQNTLNFFDRVLCPALQLPTAIRPTREPDVLGQETRGRAHPAAHLRLVPYPGPALPDSYAASAPNAWILPYGPPSRCVDLDTCHVSSPRGGADPPAPAYDHVLPRARYPPSPKPAPTESLSAPVDPHAFIRSLHTPGICFRFVTYATSRSSWTRVYTLSPSPGSLFVSLGVFVKAPSCPIRISTFDPKTEKQKHLSFRYDWRHSFESTHRTHHKRLFCTILRTHDVKALLSSNHHLAPYHNPHFESYT